MTLTRPAVVLAALLVGWPVSQAQAASGCMVSPTDKSVVSGRFGKFRGGGKGNFGSANSKPHMHDGLDFSTSGSSQPVYATSSGTITYIGARGSAGNTILVQRDGGDIIGYYHLSGFASGLAKGSKVESGQQIGLSGNTPSSTMTKHLHFVYGVGQRDDARAKSFDANATQSAFNPSILPYIFNQQSGIGWKTDPAPFFCDSFPIQDGHPDQAAFLGSSTKEQHAILFNGETPTGGDAVQQAAAASDEAVAKGEGKTVSELLSDGDGYGTLPEPPIGDYDSMSFDEMLSTESNRRFVDAQWAAQLTQVSSRALFVDLVRIQSVENVLANATKLKQERVEALYAVYVALKAGKVSAIADASAVLSAKGAVRADLNQQPVYEGD